MRRSRAYILTEIMMSMLLQSMFIVVLSGAFYMMLTFYTKTQQLQTARERGHKVISYIDQRIRHTGLGLWACGSSEILEKYFLNGGIMKGNNMNIPVSVISVDLNNNAQNASENYYNKNGDTFAGNIVTLMYAYRDFDNSRKFIFKNDSKIGKISNLTIQLLDTKGIQEAGFNEGKNKSNEYSAIEGAGLPLRIGFFPDNDNSVGLNQDLEDDISTIKVYAGSEILHFGCERLFVTSNATPEERSFAFAFPESNWSQAYHHVAGILEIYMELHAPANAPKTFDLYVLSTGGKDSSRTSKSRPASWPQEARWDDKYYEQVLYVSRASWKLNNIPEDFVFSYHN